MDFDDFFALCEEYLEISKEAHPVLAETIDNNAIRSANYGYLARIAGFDCVRSTKTALHDVLMEHVYEFLLEVNYGHLHRAKEEAADIVAVLFRAINDWMEEDDEDEEDVDYREIERQVWEDLKVDEAVERDQMRRAGEVEE